MKYYYYYWGREKILLTWTESKKIEKIFARRAANRMREILLDLHVQNQLFVYLNTPLVQFMKRKIKDDEKVRF